MLFSLLPFEVSIISVALIGALAYGCGDFLGGRASLRLSPAGAVALAQCAATIMALKVFRYGGPNWPGVDVIGSGLLGGVAYAAGLLFLYQGLAHGRIGIVAPVCGVFSILVPLIGDLVLERHIQPNPTRRNCHLHHSDCVARLDAGGSCRWSSVPLLLSAGRDEWGGLRRGGCLPWYDGTGRRRGRPSCSPQRCRTDRIWDVAARYYSIWRLSERAKPTLCKSLHRLLLPGSGRPVLWRCCHRRCSLPLQASSMRWGR